ncbi:MAG TPA: ATP-binding protein [Aggregatilineaceae bacterium]|nr:ATP-binding protein [Aggregatilineaceae bacterium]
MTFLGELRVDASSDSLRVISHFVHGIAQRLSLSDKVLFDLELAVEEAATNIISHAYHGLTSARPDIQLLAESLDGFVQVSLTDWGIPLDPANVRPFDINAPIETRIQGGMGLYFIHTLMDRVERINGSEVGDPNILTLVKRIEQAPAGLRAPSALQELNAMRTITEVMASNVELDELLNLILNKLLTTIGAERGTLYLLDEAAGELWSKVLLQEGGDLTEIRVRVGEGISGYVAQTGEILNIPDAYDDPRFNRAIDQVTGYRTRSILTAPMITPKQRIIGVVQLLNKYGGPFPPVMSAFWQRWRPRPRSASKTPASTSRRSSRKSSAANSKPPTRSRPLFCPVHSPPLTAGILPPSGSRCVMWRATSTIFISWTTGGWRSILPMSPAKAFRRRSLWPLP